ncbi:glycerol-3-phosphate 1-O-acyltransferase PlsY [Nitrogeniibacter aestuarii]|uniref:glycerol-3-phosphate 1-O-acyltransferase PlsY n=1 Tax=Nitrogeniibacter aestuarii TaxID=2815343 RepID=UPI001D111D6F|nr:glycerol-3-phosphate 1-O-acyltransferase PlsY [Nitrogeniibacter aestuarii]
MTTLTLVFVVLAYLIGSVPFAVLSSKMFGLADPRSYGSGNPGATNVLRSGKKSAAILTLVGDALKGTLAVWIMAHFGSPAPLAIALAGLAAFLGHVYPVTLGFKGGKGVATAIGVLGAFSGWLALACAVVWALVALTFKYSSLAALMASLAAPLIAHFLIGEPAITAACVIMAALLIYRHLTNIKRLMAGTEPRIGKK